ncbi:MAG: hypothetical protein GX862_09675 [Leucobacter sp.]|nr:hypothetical protein [Leucobacter sp.]
MIDALVTGRSLPALQSALDLAEVGLKVMVAGGATHDPELQAGPGHWPAARRDPDGTIAAFMHRVAEPIDGSDAEPQLVAQPETSVVPAPWLRDRKGAWAPQPTPQVLGVPAVPLAAETLTLLGGGAATRAYLDRVMPLLTVGKTRLFGVLVRKRLGSSVLKRLVDPQVYERYGELANEVEVAIAAPGLNEALSRAGSLTSAALAYSDRNVARETQVRPTGSERELVQALLKKLEWYDVELREEPVVNLQHAGDTWNVVLEGGSQVAARAVVADFASGAAQPEWCSSQASAELASLRPQHSRTYASIEIESPSGRGLDVGQLNLEGQWAVRAERLPGAARAGAARAIAVLAGPRALTGALPSGSGEAVSAAPEAAADGSRNVLDSSSKSGRSLRAELDWVLADTGYRAVAGEVWRVEVHAAPFVAVAERQHAHTLLEAYAETFPTLLPVGRALHGDEEAAGLRHAHRSTVELRRRLLGLEPEGM